MTITEQSSSTTVDQSEPLLTRAQAHKFVQDELGLPLSPNYWTKLCLPSRGDGPPVALYWGGRPMYRRDGVRAWAMSRFSNRRGTLAAA